MGSGVGFFFRLLFFGLRIVSADEMIREEWCVLFVIIVHCTTRRSLRAQCRSVSRSRVLYIRSRSSSESWKTEKTRRKKIKIYIVIKTRREQTVLYSYFLFARCGFSNVYHNVSFSSNSFRIYPLRLINYTILRRRPVFF